jgi:hypothetical protein
VTADPTSTIGAGAAGSSPRSLVAQWYDRNPARRAPEVDFGTRWTRADRTDEWRVSWNTGTGELIAARNDQSEMEVLTTSRTLEDVRAAIDGWETRALAPGGLDWMRRVTAPGIAADRTPPPTAADAILQQWSDLRTGDVSAPVTSTEVLDR